MFSPTLSSLPAEVLRQTTSYLPLPAVRSLLLSNPRSFRELHVYTTHSKSFAPWRRRYFKYQRIYERVLRDAQDNRRNLGGTLTIPSGQEVGLSPVEVELEKVSQDMLRDLGLLPALVQADGANAPIPTNQSQANEDSGGSSTSTDIICLPFTNINMLFTALEHLSNPNEGYLKLSSLLCPLSAIVAVMSQRYSQLELIQKLVPIPLLPQSSSPPGSLVETTAAYKIFTAYLLYTSLVPDEILGILSDALSISGKDPYSVDSVRGDQEMALVEYFYFLRLFLLMHDENLHGDEVWTLLDKCPVSRQARRILLGRLDAWIRAYFRPERPLPPSATSVIPLTRSSTQPSRQWGRMASMDTSSHAPRQEAMACRTPWSASSLYHPSSSPIAQQPNTNFVLTQEQQKIVDADVSAGDLVKIRAFAGTGKTMSLTEYAKQRSRQSPSTKFLYVAFNKGAQMDAKRKFGNNVVCKTMHSVALSALQKCAPKVWNALPDPGRNFKDRRQDGCMPTMDLGANFGAREVIEILGLDEEKISSALANPQEHTPYGSRKKESGKKLFPTANAVATVVKKTLERYWSSKDVNIGRNCLPRSMLERLGLRGEILLRWAERIWKDVLNAKVKYLPHDAYLKILYLDGVEEQDEGTGVRGSRVAAAGGEMVTERPLVRGEGDKVAFGAYDVIMFDEAQDSSPSMAGVILRQRPWAGLIVVGDPYQKIYGFRGANNECFDDEAHPPTYSFYLTHSFRFGDAIAGVANVLLRALREPLSVHGVRKEDSVKRSLPQALEMSFPGRESKGVQILGPGAVEDGGSGKYTVIFRGNITLVEYAIQYCLSHSDLGHRVSLLTAGNFNKTSLFKLLRAAHSLFHGNPSKRGILAGYNTWQELRDHVEAETSGEGSGATDSPGLSLVVGLEETIASPDFHDTLKLCEEMVLDKGDEADADVVLTTTHQAKGLEWDRVVVVDDFNPPYSSRQSLLTKHWREEMFITYVAVTRAKKELIVGEGILTWLAAEMGLYRFYVSPTQGNDKCPVCLGIPLLDEGGEGDEEDRPKRSGLVVGYECVLAAGSFGVKITELMAKCKRPFGLKKDVVVCDICVRAWHGGDMAGTDTELTSFSRNLRRAFERDESTIAESTQHGVSIGPLRQRRSLSATYQYMDKQETNIVCSWAKDWSALSVVAAHEEEVLVEDQEDVDMDEYDDDGDDYIFEYLASQDGAGES